MSDKTKKLDATMYLKPLNCILNRNGIARLSYNELSKIPHEIIHDTYMDDDLFLADANTWITINMLDYNRRV